MPGKNEVIDDYTDPGGALRPNLPPEPTFGTHFDPLPCPEFDHRVALPTTVDPHNPIAIFDLFFTPEQIRILVQQKQSILAQNKAMQRLGFGKEGYLCRGIICLPRHLDLYRCAP